MFIDDVLGKKNPMQINSTNLSFRSFYVDWTWKMSIIYINVTEDKTES